MSSPPPAYNGPDPYVFVCYSHLDSEVVMSHISNLTAEGVNVWYDQGISAGNVWRQDIANALDAASHVLFFVSETSVASQHCNSELHYAFDQDIPVLPVYLEETELTPDLRIGLSRVQAIHSSKQSDIETHALVVEASSRLSVKQKKTKRWYKSPRHWLLIVLSIVAAIALLIYQLVFSPVTGDLPVPDDIVASAALESADQTSLESLPETSIAVMPFDILGVKEESEWIASGLQSALIDSLSRTQQFRLPAKRNMLSSAISTADIETIGRKLNVGTVVEGTVMQENDRLRISVQLVRVRDGAQLWSSKLDRTVADIFDVQDEVSIAIAEAIRTELNIPETQTATKIARYETEDVRAYELLIKAEQLLSSLDQFVAPENRQKAFDLLNHALALDPGYPSALARKGFLLMWQGKLQEAREMAERGLEQGPHARSLMLMGELASRDLDWENALSSYEKAIELEPWNGELHIFYSQALMRVFRFDAALSHSRLATDYDPQDRLIRFIRAANEVHAGRYEEGARQFYINIELGDEGYGPANLLAKALFLQGREPEAAAMMLSAFLKGPGTRIMMLQQPEIRSHLEAGEMRQAMEIVASGLDCTSRGDLANLAAQWYALFGEDEKMFKCLEAAPRLTSYGASIRYFDHRFKPYWQHPRMIKLLEEVNLASYLPDDTPVDNKNPVVE